VIELFQVQLRRAAAARQEQEALLAKVRREAGAVLVATPEVEEDVSAINEALSVLPGEVSSAWARDSCEALET